MKLRLAYINCRQNYSVRGCRRDAGAFWWWCGKAGLSHPISLHYGVGVLVASDLRPLSQGENSSQNSLPAHVERSGITSDCRLENQNSYHVTSKHLLLSGSSTAPQNRILWSVDLQQSSDAAVTKASDGNPTFKEIIFDTVANASTACPREISSVKGRTGPMSLHSRNNTKLVRDAGGACWRCKILGKGCDAGHPCSSCPQKATAWQALGCIRGPLWDVLPRVILCPLASKNSGWTLGDCSKRLISDASEHETVANLANMYLISSQSECTLSISKLLSSAARYQNTEANDQLIEWSLLCLQASLEAIQAQEEIELHKFSHITCTSSVCKIDSFNKFNICSERYIKLLSSVIFKKKANLCKDWWLSVFYSFCIQSFVRRVLVVLVSKLDLNQATAASEYLHLAVNLFFVTCYATGKGYDPLSFDFDNLSSVESSLSSQHSLNSEEGRLAQIVVQENPWINNGIDSSYDYLGQLFGMDRTIFVSPAAKPPVYGDGSKTIAIVDEATLPPPKKRRLNQQTYQAYEQAYASDSSTATQIPDTHIIHPGSLILLESTAELPPPIPDFNNNYSVRENPTRFEGDMYTPRWVRGFRNKEGWCGFCSRWLKLSDEWFNDRCLYHGICIDTGKSFAEPQEPMKIDSAKQVWEASCETCGKLVNYKKGDRKHYSGWYMHAVNCGKEDAAKIGEEVEHDMAILPF